MATASFELRMQQCIMGQRWRVVADLLSLLPEAEYSNVCPPCVTSAYLILEACLPATHSGSLYVRRIRMGVKAQSSHIHAAFVIPSFISLFTRDRHMGFEAISHFLWGISDGMVTVIKGIHIDSYVFSNPEEQLRWLTRGRLSYLRSINRSIV